MDETTASAEYSVRRQRRIVTRYGSSVRIFRYLLIAMKSGNAVFAAKRKHLNIVVHKRGEREEE